MKIKKIIPAGLLIAMITFSCQKEIDWGLYSGSTPGGGGRLIRIKSKTGTDTTQIDYTYDAAGRLIREKTEGIENGRNLSRDLIINRNASGIITRTVEKSALLSQTGIDSVVTRYYYNSGTSRYTASVFNLPIPVPGGPQVKDSTVYNYNSAGRIIAADHYIVTSAGPIPLPPLLTLKNIYTYSSDGKNLLSISTEAASAPGDTLSPVSSQTFTYDTKSNPLIILNEAIILNIYSLFNANNVVKAVIQSTLPAPQNLTLDFTYKYNSNNKPDSSTLTRTPGGTVTKSKYFYQ